ncbi:hypothetical protein ABZZ47_29745 [Streptomyces sp. NPDC006465]|uniref:hypothetical protein n=1 Tax=Streptomyces sp. NPDC006465 TaxID=3157174 RepID=UPI0033B2EB87
MHVRLAEGAEGAEGGLAASMVKLAGDAGPYPSAGRDDGRLSPGTERIAAVTAVDEVVAISNSSETDA